MCPVTAGHQSVRVEVGFVSRVIEVACLLGAAILLAAHLSRCYLTLELHWWMPFVVLAAGLAADVVSGLVHWSADTWGHETMPVLGPRFLRPFRVHHLNPDDFLERSFIDCNGDVAAFMIPLLVAGMWIPLNTTWGPVAEVWLVAFNIWTLPTNQVHQWAHMPSPPRPVRWLQRHGVILSPEAHKRHHASPYAINYCIATGWCNRALTATGFFQRMERVVTRLTGWHPRADDRAFASRP
jgi:plasmanylethanolamine desaturase